MATPSDFDLGRSLRLVRALNKLRTDSRFGPLPQVEAADNLAWQVVLEMQKRKNRPAEPYGPAAELPPSTLRRAGFRPKQIVGYRAYKAGTELELLPRIWVQQVESFRRFVLDNRVACCGAAHQNNCYVLILAAT